MLHGYRYGHGDLFAFFEYHLFFKALAITFCSVTVLHYFVVKLCTYEVVLIITMVCLWFSNELDLHTHFICLSVALIMYGFC